MCGNASVTADFDMIVERVIFYVVIYAFNAIRYYAGCRPQLYKTKISEIVLRYSSFCTKKHKDVEGDDEINISKSDLKLTF